MPKIEIISASAGSGKTSRIARALREAIEAKQARPEGVLATTFTKKAAAELHERVRTELFRAGLHDEALRLESARIGTVNSVCGRLVGDFAIELGLSPELRVIDEEQATVALRRVISRVITDVEREEISALALRMHELDWQRAVEQLLAHARNNLISPAEFDASAAQSLQQLLAHLPEPVGDSDTRDAQLRQVIEQSLKNVDPKDTTKKTAEGRAKALEALSALRVGPAPWKAWAKAKGAEGGAKSDAAAFDPIRAIAGEVDTHPRLRSDVTRAIQLIFELAKRTMSAWQQEKRELGVLDFVDQETLALGLLESQKFAPRIAEQLDLVLVDEFQDTSPLQLRLFTRLAALAKRSVWVGDQKQAIFGFRGTDPALMDAAVESVLEGREPETLPKSYRSRRPLVALTSVLFAKAFAPQGIPEHRVRLTTDAPNDVRLGPSLETWKLGGKNKDERIASLADGIVQLLGDATVLVRDRGDGGLRRATAGDVAVLCRKNETCGLAAAALAARGIAATVRQSGLFATPEARAAVLALRLFIDARDRLAAAELARLLLHPDDPDAWLKSALENQGVVPFETASFHAAMTEARVRFSSAGPLLAFDAAVDALGLRELIARWGASSARYANLDALRAHAVSFVSRADADGSAATPAGLVAYFAFLEDEALDEQAAVSGGSSVVVSTWHGAKGLEWPITILALTGAERDPPRFGFSIRTDGRAFSMETPLAGRWIRYWPNPFHPSQTTELRRRLEEAPEAAEEKRAADKQELRLLYVGWTRARDRLVLGCGDGTWMLQALEKFPKPEASGALHWGDCDTEVVVRTCSPIEGDFTPVQPDEAPVARGPVEHPAAFISPSTLEGAAVTSELTALGERMLVTGSVDMNELGQALHGFFAADRQDAPRDERLSLAAECLRRWGQSGALRPARMVESSDALTKWAAKQAPEATWHRELPVSHRLPEGTELRGIADLVLEQANGFWLVDHKSFPGDEAVGVDKAKSFAGQLDAYARALEAAWAKPCLGMYVHLAILGRVVRLG